MGARGEAAPDAITAQLLRDERVVWWGRPGQGLVFAPSDLVLIPFSLLWGGFAVFWEWTAIQGDGDFPFVLFGAPFVSIGLFIVFGRFPLDAWLRGRMFYALTDRRVLILRSGPWASVRSIDLGQLPDATLVESSRGRGTIRFGSRQGLWSSGAGLTGSGAWLASLDPTPQFLNIESARDDFALIQDRAVRRPAS